MRNKEQYGADTGYWLSSALFHSGDLQSLQEMEIQESWGLLLSSLAITIFWSNNLLILAELPLSQARKD